MSMKKILMAAAAVTALTAGSASAITIDKATTMGGGTVDLNPASGLGTGAPTNEPYSLPNELTAPASTSVKAKLVAALGANLVADTTYLVTFTVTNGTFDNPSTGTIAANDIQQAANVAGIGSAGNFTSSTLGTTTTTSQQFVVKTAASGGGSTPGALVWNTKGIKPTAAKLPVSVNVSIANYTSPTINIDGGTSPSVTVIDFRDAVSFKATAKDQKLSIASGFKKFVPGSGTTDAAYGELANTMGTSIAGPAFTGNTKDVIFKDGNGTQLATSDVLTAVLTIGGDLSKLDGRLGSAQLADTGATNVFTVDSTNLSAFQGATATFGLVGKATALVGTEGAYTVTPVITLSSGLTAPTLATTKIGSVSFEGTSLFVPWVSDGSNGTNNVIRIGNKSATVAVTSVKASLLNPATAGTSGTVASTATCELGTIPAAGELTINSAALTTCFGAFKRSDVRLTVQGAADNLTLKMRSSTAGITTENIVGSGVSKNQGND